MEKPLNRDSRNYIFAVILGVLISMSAPAQTPSATVRGLIFDPSGQPVPNSTIKLHNLDQKREWQTLTNETGAYNLPQLPPGSYNLRVTAQGFKAQERTDLMLQVAQVAEINLTLAVGDLTEVVSVTAQVPLLEAGTSSLGEVVNSRVTTALPLNGRNSLQLISLVPGVNVTPSFRTAAVGSANTDAVAFNINGGRNLQNMILLDGSPQEVPAFNEAAFVPPPDAVQEFKVHTNTPPAEYGRTAGGVINIVHRSGTSAFHGALYEFFRNDKLDANNFFSNRNRRARAPFRYNQFGGSLGGPLTPSRQTTFFFNYEGVRQVNPGATTFTVPTERMQNGDFGELSTQIFDPLTVDESGRRQPFAGNVIPRNRIDPVAAKIVSYYPAPNRPGTANNFFSQQGTRPSIDLYSIKIDRRMSDHHNLFGRFSHSGFSETLEDHFGNAATPNGGARELNGISTTLDDTYVAGGWIFHGNYGYAYRSNPRNSPGEVLPSSLGFPQWLDPRVQAAIFPRIQPAGYAELGGNAFWIIRNEFESHTWSGDVSRLIGRHTMKFGGAYRLNRVSNRQPISPAGLYNFDEVFTREFINRGGGGNTMASFMLGLPASGQLQMEPFLATQVKYWALYIQDDWRATDRLTINAGLRWDTDRPLTERYDRAASFDYAATLPISPPGLGRPVQGGIRFVGRDGMPRGVRDPDNNNFGPRLGLAYRVTDRLLLRAGGGIMYTPITGDGPSTGRIGGLSFNSITPVTSTVDGGRTISATLSNPFPNGLREAANGAGGLLTFIGQDVFVIDRSDRTPYIGQWNFDVQYELPSQTLLDVAYAGNAGVKLLGIDPELNQLPDQDLALGDALTQTVPNPFFGIVPAGLPLGGPTTTRGQLLRPFPQFTSIQRQKASEFHSSYHALQVKVRKRYANGIQFLTGYTWSKLIDDVSSVAGFVGQQNTTYTNNNNKRLDRSISALDVPHRFVANYQWELPFGKGKRWLTRGFLSHVAGGWSLNGIITLQSGLPISITSQNNATNSFGGVQRPDSTGISSVTPGEPVERIDSWFNRAAFVNAPPFTFGNVGRFLPDNRGPHFRSWDQSILKEIRTGERLNWQLRAEFFNSLNNVNFRNPTGAATQFGRPEFGAITVAEPARSIQLALKLLF